MRGDEACTVNDGGKLRLRVYASPAGAVPRTVCRMVEPGTTGTAGGVHGQRPEEKVRLPADTERRLGSPLIGRHLGFHTGGVARE